MQPNPAAPSFDPPVHLASGDSARRILWIVGLYRAICGAALLGIALLLDLKALGIAAPSMFVMAATVYFAFGLLTFWLIQRDPLHMEASRTHSIQLLRIGRRRRDLGPPQVQSYPAEFPDKSAQLP